MTALHNAAYVNQSGARSSRIPLSSEKKEEANSSLSDLHKNDGVKEAKPLPG